MPDDPKSKFPDLKTIVSSGLCVGCGLCESVAGREQVKMSITSASRIRPQELESIDDDCMEKIRAVCPGIALTGPNEDQVKDKGVLHHLWGPIRTMHQGWSTNNEIRHRAAAGGALTGLACYLLETDLVDAIVHVRASEENPMETDALVSTTPEEVISGSQSRYGPAAPLVHIMKLLDRGTRMVVLAKPCDVAAIRNLARIDSRVDAQIPYLLTFFCGGVPTIETAKTIARYKGVPPEEVAVFRWRGNGWPGLTHIETHAGNEHDLTYPKVWLSSDVPWKYDVQFRCKICPDAIGELADISCPDSWIMVDGEPIHDEAPGQNLFIARTKRGQELVAAAAAAGAIQIEPFGIDELNAQHADHISRKVENPGRVQALTLEGELAPDYKGFRSDKMIAMAGKERHQAAIEGARNRIQRQKHREPET
jgi:coenzyme F420 hydrogenase subunit beta